MSLPMVFTAYVDSAEMGQQVRTRLLELSADRDVQAEIRIVDVTAEPMAAEAANVVGIPTVVREQPRPRRRVIGALDDSRRVADALGLDDLYRDTSENAGVVDERT